MEVRQGGSEGEVSLSGHLVQFTQFTGPISDPYSLSEVLAFAVRSFLLLLTKVLGIHRAYQVTCYQWDCGSRFILQEPASSSLGFLLQTRSLLRSFVPFSTILSRSSDPVP